MTHKNRLLFVYGTLALGLLSGCKAFFTKFAADSTVNVLAKATTSFDEESDPWLARAAATSNLKFFDGVQKATPDNGQLMVMTAKNYALYAFAFLEDDLEQETIGSPRHEELKERASDFYRRALGLTKRRLAQDFEDIEAILSAGGDRLEQFLQKADDDHLPAIYWLAYAWGSLTNLQQDPELLTDMPKFKRLMAWVRDRNPGFENGAPWLFFGALEVALPKALGGNPDASKAAFEKGLAMTDGKFLMGKAFYARFYMTNANDKKGYVRLLNEVIEAPNDIMPSQRLANELAKVRARRWIAEADRAFNDDIGTPAPTESDKPAEPAPVPSP